MAGRPLEESRDLRFDVSWPDRPTAGGLPLFDASVGRLSISIQDVLVTSYKSDKGDVGTELTIPLYDVAEWIVNNWWALLFEPRKSDEEDNGFRSRHWLGYARDGFALPDFWFHPVGDEIEVCAHEKYLRFARLQFLNSATASMPTASVRAALTDFVEDVLQKMRIGYAIPIRTPSNTVGLLGLSGIHPTRNMKRSIGSLTYSPHRPLSALLMISFRLPTTAISPCWRGLLSAFGISFPGFGKSTLNP
jgi:hypothetical protein